MPSTFKAEVVEIKEIEKHPNADSLSITKVFDYPVVIRTSDFKIGDKAIYIPIDSVVPDRPEWAFLQGHMRIKAKKLRGIFSQGMLIAATSSSTVGEDVTERLGIYKYEPPLTPASGLGGDNEQDPGFIPKYTDIENLRRYHDVLIEGEEVILTEKVHGCCSRFTYNQDRLWVGSHGQIKKMDPNNLWWKLANEYKLGDKLKNYPGKVVYGEGYGRVQDLRYGLKDQVKLIIFDVFDLNKGSYMKWDDMEPFVKELGLDIVPVLYRGPWNKDLFKHAEGKSTLCNDHCREGFVVRPVEERYDRRVGRVVLKLHGEEYLLKH